MNENFYRKKERKYEICQNEYSKKKTKERKINRRDNAHETSIK